ncbi:MAG: DNA (cytosine-5-)-methyltransferase [Muribaculum sp.]|nr:DNA (cytosine-5-)-methyltransferase [Muribaculum sp.]
MKKIISDSLEDKNRLKVASLFSGCGGSDLGMLGGFDFLGIHYKRLAFEITFAVDFDAKAVTTYNNNFVHKAVCADVNSVDFSSIEDVDVMIGGFPCQSFSTVNPTKDTNDARANLYKQIVRFLQTKKPKYFICENVKGLLTLQSGAIIRKIVSEFESCGYRVVFKLLKAVEFGIPQRRERVIIVGVRTDIDLTYSFPRKINSESNAVPLSRVIDRLAIEEQKYYFSERAVQGMKNAKNNMKRGLWQDLNGPCLTITSHLAKTSINSRDPVLLVDPDKELYRRFTPREAARIQSFPDTFKFPVSDSFAYRQIGNAVPPVFMWHIGKSLLDAIDRNNNTDLQSPAVASDSRLGYDTREWVQLSLFEPETLYLSKSEKETILMGTCRAGIIEWITKTNRYCYPVTDEDILKTPELRKVNCIIIRHKQKLIGCYDVCSCDLVVKAELNAYGYPARSSRHKANTKYLLFKLKRAENFIGEIDFNSFTPVIGKGVK